MDILGDKKLSRAFIVGYAMHCDYILVKASIVFANSDLEAERLFENTFNKHPTTRIFFEYDGETLEKLCSPASDHYGRELVEYYDKLKSITCTGNDTTQNLYLVSILDEDLKRYNKRYVWAKSREEARDFYEAIHGWDYYKPRVLGEMTWEGAGYLNEHITLSELQKLYSEYGRKNVYEF